MRSLLVILMLLVSAGIHAQDEKGLRVGGPANEKGASIILDSDGHLVIAGTSRSYGNGGDDIFVVKANLEGDVLWQKTYQWEHHEKAYSIDEADNGNYVIFGELWDGGYGREDMFLMMVDPDGNKLWGEYYGDYHTDQGFCVKSLDDGFVTVGYTSSQPGTTRGNFYMVRTDLTGNIVWEQNYGTEFLDFGFSVLPVDDDFWFLGTAGGFFNPARADYLNPDADLMLVITDSDGRQTDRKYYGGILHDWGRDMILTTDAVYLFGSTQSKGAGSFDMYLIKTDLSGDKIWEKTYGDSDFEYGMAISSDPAGNLFLLGTKQHPDSDLGPDLYIIKADQNGEVLWEQTIGGAGSDYGNDLVSLPDSGCIIMGEIENVENKQTDIYIVRIDKDGQIMGLGEPQDILKPDAVKFFPNPVTDNATIEWKSIPPAGGFKVLVYSLSGQLLQEESFANETKIELELGHLPQGMYLYQVIYSGKSLSGKFSTEKK